MMRPGDRRTRLMALLAAASLSWSICDRAAAHGEIPQQTPVDRLVTNLEAELKEKPDDARLHYSLGRLHGMAYERKALSVAVFTGPLEIADKCSQESASWGKTPGEPKPEELQKHLTEAITHLNKAIELSANNAEYHLALASVLESGEALAGKTEVHPLFPVKSGEKGADASYQKLIDQLGKSEDAKKDLIKAVQTSDPKEKPSRLRDWIITKVMAKREDADKQVQEAVKAVLLADWKERTSEQFFKAFSLSMPEYSKITEKPLWGNMKCWVAYEAAESYVRVVEKRGARDDEKTPLLVAREALKKFDNLPRSRGITPIILGMDHARAFVDMLRPDADVSFDLDGTGRPQSWSWVKPDTGILVWDPAHEGKITSGRQLFGSVTWWIFFDNGYEALDALDDNRDGELNGSELPGLAVWFDRNSNAVSDPGEVVPIEQLGIAAISCRAVSEEDGCPANKEGLRMADGRVLVTYDWIATPAELRSPTSVLNARTAVFAVALSLLAIGAPLTSARRRRRNTEGTERNTEAQREDVNRTGGAP